MGHILSMIDQIKTFQLYYSIVNEQPQMTPKKELQYILKFYQTFLIHIVNTIIPAIINQTDPTIALI